MLILYREKLKKDCLFYVSDTYVSIQVFQKQLRKAVLRNTPWYQNKYSANFVKESTFSKTAVRLQLY